MPGCKVTDLYGAISWITTWFQRNDVYACQTAVIQASAVKKLPRVLSDMIYDAILWTQRVELSSIYGKCEDTL